MYTIKVNSKEEYKIELDREQKKLTINGSEEVLNVIEVKDNMLHIIRNNKSYTAEIVKRDDETKTAVIKVNGNKYTVELKDKYDALLEQLGMGGGSSKKVNNLKAPMPGLVLDIRVAEGEQVKKGDAIVVLEAMKMENIIKSPTDGVVQKINVTKGVAVEKNQVLIHFS